MPPARPIPGCSGLEAWQLFSGLWSEGSEDSSIQEVSSATLLWRCAEEEVLSGKETCVDHTGIQQNQSFLSLTYKALIVFGSLLLL